MSINKPRLVDLVGSGEPVDIAPIAQEVIEACLFHHDLTAAELADFVQIYGFGECIPVDIQERVEGRQIHALIGFVVSRVRTAHRIKQLQEPAPIKAWEKFIELDPALDVCPAASRMTGRFLKPDELKPLPLGGCWGFNCQCEYSAMTLRDLERRGRIDASENPVPMPMKPVSCYTEDHPEEAAKASPFYRARTPRELGTRVSDAAEGQ